MNFFLVLYFVLYLLTLTATIVLLQVFNPGKAIRETMTQKQEDTEDVSDSEDDTKSSDSEPETYTMTENPMFTREVVWNTEPLIEKID